jgi:hypothetical protein
MSFTLVQSIWSIVILITFLGIVAWNNKPSSE